MFLFLPVLNHQAFRPVMAHKTETRKNASLDPTPVNMRAAIRKNTQMRRQLSKVRMSLSTEEREAQQSINKGNFRLVARLNQLKNQARKKVAEDHHGEEEESQEKQLSQDRLDSRSKNHRNKLYRQPTLLNSLSASDPGSTSADSIHLEPDTRTDLQPSPDLAKYHIPSWQRAEMIAKQNQQEQMKQKIYGRKRR